MEVNKLVPKMRGWVKKALKIEKLYTRDRVNEVLHETVEEALRQRIAHGDLYSFMRHRAKQLVWNLKKSTRRFNKAREVLIPEVIEEYQGAGGSRRGQWNETEALEFMMDFEKAYNKFDKLEQKILRLRLVEGYTWDEVAYLVKGAYGGAMPHPSTLARWWKDEAKPLFHEYLKDYKPDFVAGRLFYYADLPARNKRKVRIPTSEEKALPKARAKPVQHAT